MHPAFADFVRDAEGTMEPHAIADRLQPLLAQDGWLAPEHQAPGADSYRQHLLHVSDCRGLSVVALVWKPGQGTPIHDHVSWCVVGVYEGLERETRYRSRTAVCAPPRPSRRTPAMSRRSSRPPRTSIASRPAATSSTISIHVYGADIERLRHERLPALRRPRAGKLSA